MLLKRKKRIDDIKNKKDLYLNLIFILIIDGLLLCRELYISFLRKVKIVIVINSVFN